MDIVETALGNRSLSIALNPAIIVFLDLDRVTSNVINPSNMTVRSSIGLGNASRHRLVVHAYTSRLGSVIPAVGVAPVGALVLVVELDAKSLVDAPGDKTGALAVIVVPLVDTVALALVRVVVSHWAGDVSTRRRATALVSDVVVATSLDVVVSNIAAITGLIPDCVAVDVGSFRLAGNFDVVALLIRLLNAIRSTRSRTTVDSSACNGIGKAANREERNGKGGKDC